MNQNKRLYRNSSSRVIAGVCSGIGDYLDTDPVIFRVLFIAATLLGGSGVLVYVILWIALPPGPEGFKADNPNPQHSMYDEQKTNEATGQEQPEAPPKKHGEGNIWGGLILITLGGLFLIDRFVPRIDFGDLWPVILIVVGIILISKSYQKPKS